jgi:hypothetical protein
MAAVGLLGALLAACGSSNANKPDGSGGAATSCADYGQKYCDRLQACMPGVLTLYGFASVADCAAYYVPGCNASLAALHTGNTVALVQQCGDQLAGMSCTDLMQGASAPACLPQGGTISNGEACSSSWQCASGRCSVQSIDSCGTCVPAVPLGQTCALDGLLGSDCADNLVCAVTTVGGTTPVCAKSVALGAACADTAVCPANAYCDAATRACKQLPSIGKTCDPSLIFYCDPAKAGAFCDSVTSLCEAASVAKTGEACGWVSDSYAQCSGLCDTEGDAGVGTCSPFVSEGQPCTASDVCIPGASCTAGVCTALICGGAADSGVDAAVDAGPPSPAAFARRKLNRLAGAATAATFRPRH